MKLYLFLNTIYFGGDKLIKSLRMNREGFSISCNSMNFSFWLGQLIDFIKLKLIMMAQLMLFLRLSS